MWSALTSRRRGRVHHVATYRRQPASVIHSQVGQQPGFVGNDQLEGQRYRTGVLDNLPARVGACVMWELVAGVKIANMSTLLWQHRDKSGFIDAFSNVGNQRIIPIPTTWEPVCTN